MLNREIYLNDPLENRLADGPDEVHRAAIGKHELGKYVSKDVLRGR